MQISKWVALGAAAFFLVTVGSVVNMPHLYYMAAILVTLPAVSYLLGWYMLRGIEFSRSVPSPVWEGEEAEIVYVASNRTRIARFFLMIQEPLQKHIVSLGLDPPLFNIRGGETVRIVNRLRFDKRGVYQSDSFEVTAIDPLGVFAFTRTIPTSEEIVVYPSPKSIEGMVLCGADKLGWNEVIGKARVGGGVDTTGVRGYLPGDPLRHIHWRQTARTGNLSVIEFEETQSVNLRITLDVQEENVVGDSPEDTLEYSIRVAASAVSDAIRRGASVQLALPSTERMEEAWIGTGRGMQRGDSDLYAIMDALARVEMIPKYALSGMLASLIGSVPGGVTLLAISPHVDTELVRVLQSYVITGVAVALAYIDPSSFRSPPSLSAASEAEAAIGELTALGVPIFRFERNRSEGMTSVIVR